MEYSMSRLTSFALGLAATGLCLSVAAEAHPRLIASSPAPNAVVAKPKTIRLTFSEKLVPAFSGAHLIMTSMPGMKGHPPMKIAGLTSTVAKDGRTLVISLNTPLAAGSYKLDWHAVASDTHRIRGGFAFTVK
jgi:copper resistance protein C